MTAMMTVPWVAALAAAGLVAGCSQIIGIEDLPPVEELAPRGRSEAADAQARIRFGYSVSLSGTLLAVGAPDDASADTGIGGDPAGDGAEGSGAVYVFRHVDGSWVEEAYIKASNTGAHAHFGESVSVSGDILVVGAPYEDSEARGIDGDQTSDDERDSGAVYVFRHSGGAWAQEVYVKASDSRALGHFGWSVSASASGSALGEVFAVGAPDRNGSGAAYVFRRSGGSWIEEAVVESPRAGEADRFGDSVSVSGDMLAVGASEEDSAATGIDGEEDDNQASDSGAVYVFQRRDTAWVRDAYVKASNTGAGDMFGASVSLSDDMLAVGAYGEDSASADGDQTDDGATDSGAVYLFQRGADSWAQIAYLKASSPGAADQFGWSVTTSAGMLLAGAPGEDSAAVGVDGDQGNDGAPDSGAAYVFQRVGDSWYRKAYVKADSPGAGASFGTSVSAEDGALAVGVPCEADAAMAGGHCIGRGAVYLFQ